MENVITEVPVYAQTPPRENEQRILSFEVETSATEQKHFSGYGLRAVSCWSDDPHGRVRLDEKGDLSYRVQPGSHVFAMVKVA